MSGKFQRTYREACPSSASSHERYYMPHPTPPHPCIHAPTGSHREACPSSASSHERYYMPHPTPPQPPDVYKTPRPSKGRGPTMSRCIYVSIYLCMYLSIYLCMYVSMYLCIYVSMYVRRYVRLYICTFVRLYVCPFVRLYVCTFVRLYVCLFVRLFVCLLACLFVCINMTYHILVINTLSHRRLASTSPHICGLVFALSLIVLLEGLINIPTHCSTAI